MEQRSGDNGSVIGRSLVAPAWFRIGMSVFSFVLIAQSAWILPAELQHPRRIGFPVDQQASRVAFLEQPRVNRAAKFAVVRGNLWAESAFTYSNLLWTEQATAPAATDAAVSEAQIHLERALRLSPHRGDVWLLFAAMADRYNWQGREPSALLKMSYYTAPNEQALFLSRIKAALRAGGLKDPELRDMIGRDIRLVISKAPELKPALAAIYKAESGPSKQFIERVVSEVDPAYLAGLRAGLH
jgi:hypothetical protein